MPKFIDLVNNLGYTYLDRLFEKLAYKLSENIDNNVSGKETIKELADEIAFTDDGYLYSMIFSDYNFDVVEDVQFKIQYVKKSNNYVLLIDDKLYSAFESLSSVLKSLIEDYFN